MSEKKMTPDVYRRLIARCVECGDCLLWQGAMGGSGTVTPSTSIGKKRYYVRRLMWEKKGLGPAPADKGVRATCGEARCVAPKHLQLTTKSESGKRAGAAGKFSTISRIQRLAATKQATQSPLTWDQVREIRDGTDRLKDAAERYGVSIHTISKIRRGIAWRDYSNPFAALMPAMNYAPGARA